MTISTELLENLLQNNNISSIIDALKKTKNDLDAKKQPITTDLTVVTGLWNISRQGRNFDHYIEHFKKFLHIPIKMFIYIPKDLEHLVWEIRSKENTFVKITELEDLKNNLYAPFWKNTQAVRQSPAWYNQTGENGWLKNSPQAVNEWYNPIVQSKMFLLHDAKILNVFNTNYFFKLKLKK